MRNIIVMELSDETNEISQETNALKVELKMDQNHSF